MKSKQLESDIQRAVIKKLEAAGWYVIKLIQTNKNGIPDLICHKDEKTIYFEVKMPGKEITKLQSFRIDELGKYGISVYTLTDISQLKEII